MAQEGSNLPDTISGMALPENSATHIVFSGSRPISRVTFGVLYVFFVLSLERRRVLHVNVTAHPHAAWAAQQIVEALGLDAPPMTRLIRDRDSIFGKVFDARGSTASAFDRCEPLLAPLGRTASQNGSWARSDASDSIT